MLFLLAFEPEDLGMKEVIELIIIFKLFSMRLILLMAHISHV